MNCIKHPSYVLIGLILSLCTPGISIAQKYKAVHKAVLEEAGALEAEINRLSMGLWQFSETALLEEQSAALLMASLEQEGFDISRGVAGMPTAFVASYGSGSPVIGILAEYDALPGVGNAPVPRKVARKDGVADGHGCGHNLFGAASVAGAIAIKRVMEQKNIPGTLRLYGTPAEETVVGKVYMAKEGVFDELDACIDWHPGTETQASNRAGLAMNNFQVEFFGQAAHGAADPWNGRSALDAVEMMNFGVNLMREHVMPTTRIHYVITDGGKAPNVVPDYARVWYYVRDINREQVERYYGRILNIAEAAALATNTEHQITLITGVHAKRLNRPLLERMQAHLEYVGGPVYSEEEQKWARELQTFVGKEAVGFKGEVLPLAAEDAPPDHSGGSTDVAEVSHITPTVGFRMTTAPAGVPWHSWATSASHGTPAGVKGAIQATKVIGLMGVDLLTDADLLKAAKADFQKNGGNQPYISPVPKDQQVMLPVGSEKK